MARSATRARVRAGATRGARRSQPVRGRPERRQTAGDGSRERILNAALAVFAEHGFDGARTRDIAERADANLGLIKYYFDGKEKLWKAAVTRAFEELQADSAAGLQGRVTDDPPDQPLAWL